MRLLGHKSTVMTLWYAAVSPKTVRREFEAAIANMEKRHQLQDQIKIPLRTGGGILRRNAQFKWSPALGNTFHAASARPALLTVYTNSNSVVPRGNYGESEL